MTIPRGRYDDLEAQLEMEPQLMAPLAEGQVIGKVNVRLGDDSIASLDLLALESVEEAGFFGSAADSMKLWFDGLFEGDEDDEQRDQ